MYRDWFRPFQSHGSDRVETFSHVFENRIQYSEYMRVFGKRRGTLQKRRDLRKIRPFLHSNRIVSFPQFYIFIFIVLQFNSMDFIDNKFTIWKRSLELIVAKCHQQHWQSFKLLWKVTTLFHVNAFFEADDWLSKRLINKNMICSTWFCHFSAKNLRQKREFFGELFPFCSWKNIYWHISDVVFIVIVLCEIESKCSMRDMICIQIVYSAFDFCMLSIECRLLGEQ